MNNTNDLNNLLKDVSNINIDKDKDKDKKSKKSDNCQELKNIAYKTMLLNGTDINPKYDYNDSNDKISNFLDNESNANKKESWSKLDKTQKVKHLHIYSMHLKEIDGLIDDEVEKLKNYLLRCLDRKSLIKTKEVIYDKDTNKIIKIPYLIFNKETRTYILKKDDKHVSTAKSLPVDMKKCKQKTSKNYKIENK
tara:strand:+ start:133 stop:714 length:582 start_codon:yes stop_codon:yes gene_type:complete